MHGTSRIDRSIDIPEISVDHTYDSRAALVHSGRHICQCLFSPAVRDGIAVVRHCHLHFQARSLGVNAEDTYLLHISFHCLEMQVSLLHTYGHHERGILEHPGNLLALIHESLSDFRSRLIQEVRVLSLVASCTEYQHAGSQPYSV